MTNFLSYFEALSDLFMDLGRICPQYDEYQILFPNCEPLQQALFEFHASIVHCCRHVVAVAQRPCTFKPVPNVRRPLTLLQGMATSFVQSGSPSGKSLRPTWTLSVSIVAMWTRY